MKTTIKPSGLERIADSSTQKAIELLEKKGYTVIDPDAMGRAREAFEVRRQMEAEAYRQYIDNRGSYNGQ